MKPFLLTTLTILAFCAIAPADDHIAGVLSLEDCFRLLDDRNSQLQAARENIAAAQARRRIALGQKYPEISAGASYSVVSDVTEIQFPGQTISLPPPTGPVTVPGRRIAFGDEDAADLRLSLGIPIYTGGVLTGNVRLSDLATQIAEADYRRIRQELRHRVRTLFLNFLKSQKAEGIAHQEVQRNERHVQDVRNRRLQGMAVDVDLLQARIALSQSQQILLARTNESEQARLALLSIHQLPPDSPITFSEQQWGNPPQPDEVPAEDKPLDSRTEIRKMTLEVQAARERRALETSNQKPSLYFSSSGHYGRPGLDPVQNEWMPYATAGLNLDFTLFRGGAITAQVEEKQKAIDALENQYLSTERQIILERQSARLTLNTAQSRWELAREQLDNARERFRVTETMWNQGMATETSYQDARETLTESELSLSAAALDYWLALAELIRANGEE